MRKAPRSHVDAERLLAPATLVLCIVLTALGVCLLGASLARAQESSQVILWVLLALMWAVPVVLDLRHLLCYRIPTVGMVEPVLAGLVPAALSWLVLKAEPAWFGLACLGVSLLSVILHVWSFVRIYAATRDLPPVADDATIICLGGPVLDGVPSRMLAARLRVAADLALSSPARTLVVTGGAVMGSQSEACVMSDWLRKAGVDEGQVVCEDQACNTRENVLFALELVRQRGLAGELRVLTSDFHLRRALDEFKRLGIKATGIAAPTPVADRLQAWCCEVLTSVHMSMVG